MEDIRAKISKIVDFLVPPTIDIPWQCEPFTEQDVREAILEKQFNKSHVYPEYEATYHIQRIAYLYVHGWDDAIVIDVGCPSLGYINDNPIIDGNHRLYAALLRGDDTILCSIEGEIDYAAEILT